MIFFDSIVNLRAKSSNVAFARMDLIFSTRRASSVPRLSTRTRELQAALQQCTQSGCVAAHCVHRRSVFETIPLSEDKVFSLLFFLSLGSGKKNSRKKRAKRREEKVPRTWAASVEELSSRELRRRESGRRSPGTKRFELPCVFLLPTSLLSTPILFSLPRANRRYNVEKASRKSPASIFRFFERESMKFWL